MSAEANERDPSTEMVLKATGNSWVEIEDVDGNILMTRLMRPGETENSKAFLVTSTSVKKAQKNEEKNKLLLVYFLRCLLERIPVSMVPKVSTPRSREFPL